MTFFVSTKVIFFHKKNHFLFTVQPVLVAGKISCGATQILFWQIFYCVPIFFIISYGFINFFSKFIREVLERDGTAVDAAIAALFCDSLHQSSNMGPGKVIFIKVVFVCLFDLSPVHLHR